MTGFPIRHLIDRTFPLLLGVFAVLSPLTRSVQEYGFSLCFALFVIHRYCAVDRPAMRMDLRPFYLVLAVYLGVAIVSLVYSADPVEGKHQFMQLNMLLLCMIFAERIMPAMALRALWLFVAGTTAVAVIALFQGLWLHIDRPPTIMYCVHGGIVLLFGITVLLSLLTVYRGWQAKSAAVGLLLLHGWALYLNGTRTAWAGAAVVLTVSPLLVPALTRRRKLVYLAVVVATMVVFAYGPYARYQFHQAERDVILYRNGTDDTSLGGRFDMWKASLLMFRRHPVLGVGLGGWQETLNRMALRGEAPAYIKRYNQTHNAFLDALSTRGMAGLLSFVALMAAPIFIALRNADPQRAVFRSVLVLLGLAALVTCNADTLVRLRMPFMSYIVVTSIAFAGLASRGGEGEACCLKSTLWDDRIHSRIVRN